ncbi:MAG: ribonuclease-3 [Myxococcota bacterium]|jgi:ribonuclease-3
MSAQRWALYIQAVTHTSFAEENGGPHNERLEFIGDAVLQLCTSDLLFRRFPDANEGEMSRMRKQVVNNVFLARIARQMGVGSVLRLGRGEALSGGSDRESNLSGAFESLLGAVYLDQGIDAAMQVVFGLFEPLLGALPDQRSQKLVLHEWCQQTYQHVPRYSLLETTGPDHDRRFRMAVSIDGEVLGEGEGTSKRRAQSQAAIVAVSVLRARGVSL